MKIRRFIGKRRRRGVQRLRDSMAAKHLGREDRQEIADYLRFLRGQMPEGGNEWKQYVTGQRLRPATWDGPVAQL